jgi:hypothetical protein
MFLIVLGVVFLATQFVPGLAWWNMWPLIIVASGFIQMVTPDEHGWGVNRVFEGVGTMLIGLVFLGNTMGYISWSVWWVLLTLWPVLIIAIGLSVLGRGLQLSWLRALSPLVLWLALGYAVAASFTGAGGFSPMIVQVQNGGQSFSVAEPVSGATAATLSLKGGAGDISVESGPQLIEASGSSAFGSPSLVVKRQGDTADAAVTLGNTDHAIVVPGVGTSHADVKLSGSVLWDAKIETGASNLDANLSEVRLRSLVLSTGVSSASIKLGEVPSGASSTDVTVKAGVSSVTILVPKDAEARVVMHNGLTGTTVNGRFVRQSGGVWQTPDYTANGRVLNISVESGVGSVSVQTY